MKACVIYTRVSSHEQAEHGTSLETQLTACRAYASEHGYMVLDEISEDFTGARLDRPGMNRVRDIVAEGTADALLVYALDRLARDTGDTLVVLKECKVKGCELVTVSQPYEDTPAGKMLLTMLAAIAEYERHQIIERTQRGKTRAAQNGRVQGTPYTAYGYRYIVGEARLEVYEPEAEWVARMFRWVADEGVSLYEVTRRLNAAAAPSRTGNTRKWSHTLVRRIMRSPVYRGEYIYNRRRYGRRRERSEWVSIPVPAIVSGDVWQAAQDAMDRAALYRARNVKHDYLLRGLVYCSVCGYRMYGRIVGAHRYYMCFTHEQPSRPAQAEKCGVRLVRADRAESLVWAEVVRQLVDEALVRDWLSTVRDEREGQQYADRLAILRGRLTRLSDEAERARDMYQTGDSDRADFTSRMEAIKRRREGVEAEAGEVEAQYRTWQRERAPALDWQGMTARLREMLPYATWEQRRAFLTSLDLRLVWGVDKTLTVYGLPQVVVLSL